MSKSYFIQCPRCGSRSYEVLATHCHCIECLYSNDLVSETPKRDFMTLREAESVLRAPGVATETTISHSENESQQEAEL